MFSFEIKVQTLSQNLEITLSNIIANSPELYKFYDLETILNKKTCVPLLNFERLNLVKPRKKRILKV